MAGRDKKGRFEKGNEIGKSTRFSRTHESGGVKEDMVAKTMKSTSKGRITYSFEYKRETTKDE